MKRITIATVLALASILGFRVMAAQSDYGDDKPGPVEGEQADAPPVPGEPNITPTTFTVPASTTPPQGVSCPNGWSYFNNPVGHYSLCYPQGWGFTEFRTTGSLSRLRNVTLTNLHLLSADAFPLATGEGNFDIVTRHDAMDVEINVATGPSGADPGNPGPCIPGDVSVFNGRTFLSCKESYDPSGATLLPSGPFHVLKIRTDLKRAPLDTDAIPVSDASKPRVDFIVRSSSSRFTKEVDLLWQLARSVRPY